MSNLVLVVEAEYSLSLFVVVLISLSAFKKVH